MTRKPTRSDLGGARYLALQRLARTKGRATAELLQLYVLESFIGRVAGSRHDARLVLKGGLLMAAFDLRRPTRDVDLLALRADSDAAAVSRMVADVIAVERDDGVVFLLGSIDTEIIRDDDMYPGIRVTLEARLATARIKFSVDVNVGDPMVPPPLRTTIPSLLDGDHVHILAYSKAMVIAEKLVTALQRGRANTRWRDFADLFLLTAGDVVEAEVVTALRTVAAYRGVTVQPLSMALAGMVEVAESRWVTWLRRQGLVDRVPTSFKDLLRELDDRTHAWLVRAVEIPAAD